MVSLNGSAIPHQMNFTRRDLVRSLPVAVSACLLTQGSKADSSPSVPAVHFPIEARARLAVTSWAFRSYLESPTNQARKHNFRRMDMKEFPAFVAEQFGVRNINPLGAHFASADDSYLASFRQAVNKAGSHVVDLGLGGRYFYDPDPAAVKAAVDYGRKWIDIAVKIGSPSVRQHLELHPGQKPKVAIAAESLGRLADHAAKHNIVVNLENDNARAEDPFVLVAVIEKVNSRYLRALPDFGNSLIGHDREYNERAVKAMLGHAWNMCHVKDVVEREKGGGGLEKVDLGKMFDLAKQSSFLGYYSMEYEIDAGDPIAGTQKLVERSLQYLG